MRSEKIVVICWGKASDAVLVRSLESEFNDIRIVIYKIPPKYWMSWIWRRIKTTSVCVLLGHLLLSAWIRGGRLFDWLVGKSIWNVRGVQTPSWRKIRSSRFFAPSERVLKAFSQDADVILFTDNIRLSHRFYRTTKAKILQIIWGSVPDYMGDSGGFWAYALGMHEGYHPTIIQRDSQYNNFTVLGRTRVRLNNNETLRTLKVKQVATLAEKLGAILQQEPSHDHRSLECRTFYAPTLFTYLHFLLQKHSLKFLPAYAYKKHLCIIKE